MIEEMENWLTKCADFIADRSCLPVSIEGILNHYGITIKEEDKLEKGEVTILIPDILSDGFIVKLRRSKNQGSYSVRERFVLAHELGHVLLIRKFQWNPRLGEEFFLCEKLCNLFAAHLLVPCSLLSIIRIEDSKIAFETLSRLQSLCKVSTEVVARRLVETFPRLIYFGGTIIRNAKTELVFVVRWVATTSTILNLVQNKHIKNSDTIGRFLLQGNEMDYFKNVCVFIENTGWLYGEWFPSFSKQFEFKGAIFQSVNTTEVNQW